jgi:von Willebrand factor type D domain
MSSTLCGGWRGRNRGSGAEVTGSSQSQAIRRQSAGDGWRWMLRLALVLCAAAAALVAADRAAAAQLVLPASSLRGFHSASVSRQAAVADLAAGLPRSLVGVVAHTDVQVSALASRTQHVRSDAFVFGSARAAERVLAVWGRLRHPRRVRVGATGYLSARRGKVIVVAWLDGTRIGMIALTESRGTHDPGAHALGDAVLADGWLRSPLPTTAWGKVLDQIRPDGTVSKRTALEAFAVVYGPLPGVHHPAGRRATIPSGTLAAQWVLSYWRQLTSAQRRVVQRRLGAGPAGSLAHAADYGDPGFQPDPAIQVLAYKYVKIYQARLGHTLGLTVVAGKSTTTNGTAYADTLAVGNPLVCRIRVLPPGQQVMSQQNVEFVPPLDLILAHEVFHCFQGDITGWKSLPAWITEGMADWAALTVDPVAYFHGGGNLNTYITNPHTPLFQRSYDAVGFWGHAEDVVPNQWASIPAILNVGSDEGAFHLAGGDADAFLTSWGSSVFRLNCCGYVPWQMQSPITPPSAAQVKGGQETADLLAMPIVQVDAPALTTSQYKVLGGPTEPVVHVSITGHARLSEHYNYTKLENAWFCMSAAPCQCPKNTMGQVPPTLPLGNVTAFPLGLSGDPGTGTSGDLSSFPLSHFCQPKQPSQPGGTGVSNGDPYIIGFDGGHYGFQNAGEFTLVKSTVDGLEIQSRQVPYRFVLGSQWGNSLAMNTAFAIRDGNAIVEIDKGSPLVLYIDRHRRRARSGEVIALSGGGAVRYTRKQVTVSWADGTKATVLSIGDEGVNIYVNASASRAGRLRGLLGSDDGKLADDFVGRDGRRYNPKKIQSVGLIAATRAQIRILLGGFGRSWRITQAQSLFVYPPGKNTRSYLVPGFPRTLMSLRALTATRRLAAARACAGVADALRVGCEIDFGATADHRLAAATRALEQAAGLPPASVDLSGRWSGQYSGAFQGTFTLNWQQSGSNLNGTIKLSNPRVTIAIRGTVSGRTIRFGNVGFVTYSGAVFGDSMSGKYRSPRGDGSWSATKNS